MIYEAANATAPIRQGDIFRGVPRVDAAFDNLPVLEDGSEQPVAVGWKDLVAKGQSDAVTAIVAVKTVDGIVISQDCDAIRSPYIALCEIGDFAEVEPKAKSADKPKSWMSIITQHARINQKWFYLPSSDAIGFKGKKGVDFRKVVLVPRDLLDALRENHRVGRLIDVASAHFRERLSEFFRRYPYDEWYPLTKDELGEYQKSKPEPIAAYPWQK